MSQINNPSHYGGKDNPYEAIKVIDAHQLNFNLGNVVKYVLRAGKKQNTSNSLVPGARNYSRGNETIVWTHLRNSARLVMISKLATSASGTRMSRPGL